MSTVQDGSIDSPDNRYHDTTGKSIHGSPYEFLAPKLQHALVDSPFVMMNVHGFYRQGQAVDAVVNCTKFERPNGEGNNCQAVSAFNPPKTGHGNSMGPFGFIATPIFPANDPDTLVGFIFGAVFWKEVMMEMVRINYYFLQKNMQWNFSFTLEFFLIVSLFHFIPITVPRRSQRN